MTPNEEIFALRLTERTRAAFACHTAELCSVHSICNKARLQVLSHVSAWAATMTEQPKIGSWPGCSAVSSKCLTHRSSISSGLSLFWLILAIGFRGSQLTSSQPAEAETNRSWLQRRATSRNISRNINTGESTDFLKRYINVHLSFHATKCTEHGDGDAKQSKGKLFFFT